VLGSTLLAIYQHHHICDLQLLLLRAHRQAAEQVLVVFAYREQADARLAQHNEVVKQVLWAVVAPLPMAGCAVMNWVLHAQGAAALFCQQWPHAPEAATFLTDRHASCRAYTRYVP
jgi:hypothetical protein